MLTNKKHIAFLNEYMSNGQNGQKAYSAVYKINDERVAAASASRLLASVNIKLELAKLQAQAYQQQAYKRDELLRDLIDIKNQNKDSNPAVALKAIEQYAKMLGLNEPEKVEHSGSQPITVIRTIEVSTSAEAKEIYGSTHNALRIDAANVEDVDGIDTEA